MPPLDVRRVAIYARVSTFDQEPENQLLELRRYVAARGWTAVEFVDRGVSGAKDKRPALDTLVKDAKRRRFDVVVCWRLDRLGRNLKHLILLLDELSALGVGFVSLAEGIDATTPAGRLQLHILGAIAEFERERIRERVRPVSLGCVLLVRSLGGPSGTFWRMCSTRSGVYRSGKRLGDWACPLPRPTGGCLGKPLRNRLPQADKSFGNPRGWSCSPASHQTSVCWYGHTHRHTLTARAAHHRSHTPMSKKTASRSQALIKKTIDSSHREVTDWAHLHTRLESMRDTGWIFRGVTSTSHYPIPSIGREAIFGHYKRAQEERLFQEFKDRAVALLNDARFTDWDWLAYAQHIGVPTRLLDWTANPLVALFFALESDDAQDRVVYAVKYSRYIHEVERTTCGPFDNSREGRFTPPLSFDRIRAQRGLFTIHPDPTKIFAPDGMKTLLIPSSRVQDFRRRLFKYGIDHWHIYPDAHGLGRQLSWQFKNRVGLGQVFMIKK